MKEYPLINPSLLIFLAMVQRMAVENDALSHLDLLLQQSLRYKHHKENYLYSLEHGIIPSGLKINRKPAFVPVSNDFTNKWNNILRSAEEKLVNLLLSESDNVIDNLQSKIKGSMAVIQKRALRIWKKNIKIIKKSLLVNRIKSGKLWKRTNKYSCLPIQKSKKKRQKCKREGRIIN